MENQKDEFFKTQWIVLGFAVFIGAVVFLQFYDVAIIKKSNILTSTGDISVASNLEATIGSKSLPDLDLDVKELEVDLENLSDDELNSAQAFLKFKKIKAAFIPTGVPEIYGEELDISFDEVQDAINKVQIFGPTYGEEEKKIVLTGPDLERYKKIGASIACEYCCGVETLTREDGSAACGCAHSVMMRGLAAYLIKNHPELSDEWILEQLTKWKITYFPKQTLSMKLKELEESGEEGIKELLQEFPDFLPQMVGGC